MSDRELLELAATAAGIGEREYADDFLGFAYGERDGYWNPLTDDGDALRLAVKAQIDISFGFPDGIVHVVYPDEPCHEPDIYEDMGGDPYAATRRAIVRAAAEIGREMS